MPSYRVTRIESNEYETEIEADSHDHAETLAKIAPNEKWEQKLFYIDYTCIEQDYDD